MTNLKTWKMAVEPTNAPLSKYFIKWVDVQAACPATAKSAAEVLNPGCTATLCSIMPDTAK